MIRAESRRMKFTEGELAAVLERYLCATAAHNQCLTAPIGALTNDSASATALAAEERQSHSEVIAARERLIFALSLGRPAGPAVNYSAPLIPS